MKHGCWNRISNLQEFSQKNVVQLFQFFYVALAQVIPDFTVEEDTIEVLMNRESLKILATVKKYFPKNTSSRMEETCFMIPKPFLTLAEMFWSFLPLLVMMSPRYFS